jgi:DNA-binding NtrC family response regulator
MGIAALKKIMIVDDDQSILTSLSYLLKADGVGVITCSEIEQAEAALETTHFDLVIVDIRMSGVTGIEGLELLSYVRDRFDSKVIVMTGYDSSDTRNEAYRRGAHSYFQKPVDIAELLRQVALAGIPLKGPGLRDSRDTRLQAAG